MLNSSYKNDLHLFNTKKFDDSFFKKTFRSIFLLNWNEKVFDDIDKEINDSLFSIFTENLRDNITISNLRNTDVLKVAFSSYDPYEASLIVNTIIDVYQKRDQEWASGEMSHLIHFLTDQLELKEIDLKKLKKI